MLHHRDTVQFRAYRVQLLAFAKVDEASLELVHSYAEIPGLGLVACGAVTAGQLVQTTEEWTGIVRVTSGRRVGPAHLVGVEPQMKRHEPLDVVNDLGRIAQLLHSLARHSRPDNVVVMEVNPAGTDRARQGLPDVVKEGSQAKSPLGICLLDDGERVSENVLVPLDWVLLEGECRQLGKELLG